MPGSMTSTVPSRSIRTQEWVYLVMRADREGAEPVVMGSSRFCAAWVPVGVCYQCGALTARNRGRRASCIAGYPVSPAGQLFLRLLIAETGSVSGRLRVREIDDDEGRRLVRIIRRGSGSVVTWRRAQMVLLSAQGRRVVISEA